jgi:hypothetical protein
MKILEGNDDNMTINIFTVIEEMKNQIVLYQKSINPIKRILGNKYKNKLKIVLNKFKGIEVTYELLYIFIDFVMLNNIEIDEVSIDKKYGINMTFPYMIIKFNDYTVEIELNNPNILLNIVYNNGSKYEGTVVKYELYQRIYTESSDSKLINALNIYISNIIYDTMIMYLNSKEIKL